MFEGCHLAESKKVSLVLGQCRHIDAKDFSAWAWNGLRSTRNLQRLKDRLIQRHSVERRHWKNVEKQAKQIRSCLLQAEQYYFAAEAASLAIKPMLLYYSAMSLALAEILWKQSGESSLDRMRATNRHHGLMFRERGSADSQNIADAAANLIAFPLIVDDSRKGTFEMWHRTARHLPMVGEFESVEQDRSKHVGHDILLTDLDRRLPLIPADGVNLFDAVRFLPDLQDYFSIVGIETKACRAWIRRQTNKITSQSSDVFLVHPNSQSVIDGIVNRIRCSAAAVNALEISKGQNSVQILERTHLKATLAYEIDYPIGINRNSKDIYLLPSDPPLNEFGMIYLALFICGNYCRYFPDIWMNHLERDHAIARLVEQVCVRAAPKMAALILSEIESIYFLPSE